MNIYLKVLAAGAFALAIAQPASASTQVSVGIYADAPVQYHPAPVRVHPYYVAAPVYYAGPVGYAEPAWRGRHDRHARREARLRRQEWRHEQRRREQWMRDNWRDDRGWDGRR